MAENVVVLGAGMAGLAAARLLAEAGRKVLVLEAAQRVGGRIYTVRGAQGQPVELGAEFVHGRPAELLALIAEAGLTTYERTGSFLVSHDGALLDENARGDADGDREANSDDDEPLELLKTYSGADISFAAYVDQLGLSEKERAEQVGYVEGFNAADAREASVLALGRQQAAEDVIDGERLAKIHGGYAQLPEFLAAKVRAAGGEIVLGARVRQVSKSTPHGFAIVCEDGGEFHADHVVVALPLGVLRTGSVGLPAAAETILQTVNGLRMGPVWRMTFLFKRRLWPAAMSFLLTRGVSPAVWWTDHPGDERMLTGWSGGPRSLELLAMPPAQMCAHAESTLAEALGLAVAEVSEAVEEVHFYDWQTDPLASGSYSWVAVGGLEDSARFAVPVRFTTPGLLCFAGEHTDTTGLWGTVHAAYGSGLRAGQAVLREMLEA